MSETPRDRKPLTPQMLKILERVSEGRVRTDKATGRWKMEGVPVPSRARKLLAQRGYIEARYVVGETWADGYSVAYLTDLGAACLADIQAHEHPLSVD